jgi:hypothetical protein
VKCGKGYFTLILSTGYVTNIVPLPSISEWKLKMAITQLSINATTAPLKTYDASVLLIAAEWTDCATEYLNNVALTFPPTVALSCPPKTAVIMVNHNTLKWMHSDDEY